MLLSLLAESDSLPQDDVVAQMFDTAHNVVKLHAQAEGYDASLSGTTCTVCVIHRATQQVLTAWTGDSRCICGRLGSEKRQVEIIGATQDHKPQDPDERRRIIGSGGEVVRIHSDLPHRVYVRGKEAPGLAMSRALGDLMAHTVGVNHVPGFKRFTLEADSCLLCCSDGVWEFIRNPEALKLVLSAGRDNVGEATRSLAKEARDRWLREEGSMTDDITAIVIWGPPKA